MLGKKQTPHPEVQSHSDCLEGYAASPALAAHPSRLALRLAPQDEEDVVLK